ncbi:hypothetical protein [Echinicola salinicaeni]|nr:hypothetical protein [Echinicola salinicaeni]
MIIKKHTLITSAALFALLFSCKEEKQTAADITLVDRIDRTSANEY